MTFQLTRHNAVDWLVDWFLWQLGAIFRLRTPLMPLFCTETKELAHPRAQQRGAKAVH